MWSRGCLSRYYAISECIKALIVEEHYLQPTKSLNGLNKCYCREWDGICRLAVSRNLEKFTESWIFVNAVGNESSLWMIVECQSQTVSVGIRQTSLSYTLWHLIRHCDTLGVRTVILTDRLFLACSHNSQYNCWWRLHLLWFWSKDWWFWVSDGPYLSVETKKRTLFRL